MKSISLYSIDLLLTVKVPKNPAQARAYLARIHLANVFMTTIRLTSCSFEGKFQVFLPQIFEDHSFSRNPD